MAGGLGQLTACIGVILLRKIICMGYAYDMDGFRAIRKPPAFFQSTYTNTYSFLSLEDFFTKLAKQLSEYAWADGEEENDRLNTLDWLLENNIVWLVPAAIQTKHGITSPCWYKIELDDWDPDSSENPRFVLSMAEVSDLESNQGNVFFAVSEQTNAPKLF